MYVLRIKPELYTISKGTSGTVRVVSHVREGHRVKAHSRTSTVSATKRQMDKISNIITKNESYLVFMAKKVAAKHGIKPIFDHGMPSGDLADLVSEGKLGMIIGGTEHLKGAKKVDQLTQMKTRGNQMMSSMAKKLRHTVTLPEDVVRHLSIVSAATEQYRQAHNGNNPTSYDLSEMVTLSVRTNTGKLKEITGPDKVKRIELLATYAESQNIDPLDLDEGAMKIEDDSTLVSRWSSEQRDLRKKVHKIMGKLIAEKKLSKQEQTILYLRFYIDDPDKSSGMNTRSFEAIAGILDKMSGLKKVKARSGEGDPYRFQPWKTVIENGVSKKVRYKSPITGNIVNVGKANFTVKRGKQIWDIKGKPPFKKLSTKKSEVWAKYNSAIKKVLSHPTATAELKATMELMGKNIKIYVLTKVFR